MGASGEGSTTRRSVVCVVDSSLNGASEGASMGAGASTTGASAMGVPSTMITEQGDGQGVQQTGTQGSQQVIGWQSDGRQNSPRATLASVVNRMTRVHTIVTRILRRVRLSFRIANSPVQMPWFNSRVVFGRECFGLSDLVVAR